LQQLAPQVDAYNPFNLLVCDGRQLMGLESRGARIVALPPGLGGVSNAGFNTPWPKLMRLQDGLCAALAPSAAQPSDLQALLTLLHDPTLAPDEALPHTGMPLELERALSAIFVATPRYGTRACSVVQLQRHRATFVEQTIEPGSLYIRHTHMSGFGLDLCGQK
jgi:uncharacterized protein with NRDE domain